MYQTQGRHGRVIGVRLVPYHSPTGDHVCNAFLDIAIAHEATGLAFKMVDSCSERGKLPAAAAVGTMIKLLLVYHKVSPSQFAVSFFRANSHGCTYGLETPGAGSDQTAD